MLIEKKMQDWLTAKNLADGWEKGENLPDGWDSSTPSWPSWNVERNYSCSFSLDYQSRDRFWEIPFLLFSPSPTFLHKDTILHITQNCIGSFLKTHEFIFASSLCLYFGIEWENPDKQLDV
mgnify:CR=1 FL=1